MIRVAKRWTETDEFNLEEQARQTFGQIENAALGWCSVLFVDQHFVRVDERNYLFLSVLLRYRHDDSLILWCSSLRI
jgi:hypothetical protein